MIVVRAQLRAQVWMAGPSCQADSAYLEVTAGILKLSSATRGTIFSRAVDDVLISFPALIRDGLVVVVDAQRMVLLFSDPHAGASGFAVQQRRIWKNVFARVDEVEGSKDPLRRLR